jgi:hypothetical protein
MKSSNRLMRCEEHVARMGKMRNAYNILVINYEEKIPLRISRNGLEVNIKMGLNVLNPSGYYSNYLL